MKYQSEKFSIRAQDGISYNAILSQIYFLLYKEFSSFLPLSSQIAEVKGNFIKQELIKNLNEQKFPEKILNVYADNKEFFEKKYSITEAQISVVPTNEQKGDIILGRIIDEILNNINKQNASKDSLKDIIFGKNNEYITGCPVITQNNYLELSEQNLSDDDFYNLTFLQSNAFSLKTALTLAKPNPTIDLKETNPSLSNSIFSIKKYFNSFVFNSLDNSGFHFEKFIIFDFDKSGFINDPKISYEPPLIYDQKDKKLNFELFYYSCLNTCFYLSDNTGTKDIIVNPEYFKKVFPLDLEGDGKSRQLYDLNVIQKYFSSFIKNVRYGLRLVCRQSILTEGAKENKYKYTEEIYKNIKKPFHKSLCFVDKAKPSLERPSSFQKYDNGKIKDSIEIKFTNLEYSILKEKSYILFIEAGGKKVNIRRIWTPLSYVYSDNVLNPYGSNIESNVLLAQIHDLINNDEKILEELKNKIVNTIEYKYVFDRLVPLKAISFFETLDISALIQKEINTKLSMNKETPAIVANSLQDSFSSLIESSLEGGGY